jgi:L-amino acid N-acyltransferase YncA
MIRKGTLGDLQKVGRLFVSFCKELAPSTNTYVDGWRNITATMMQANILHMLVIEENQKIVGWLDWMVVFEPCDSLVHAIGRHLYIIPEYRGKGLSLELRAAQIDILEQENIHIMEATTVIPEYFEKLGYKRTEVKLQKRI